MLELSIQCPEPFHFEDVVFSHGWLQLPPYHWDPEIRTLSRVERLPSGSLTRLELTAAENGVLLRTDASPADSRVLVERVRWILALDDDLSAFHAFCAGDPGLRAAGERGRGRILRCPTVWEDLVKTLFSVNTTWGQTVAMSRNLVEQYGEPHPGGQRAFPEPSDLAALPPAEVQGLCRVGYRAEPLVKLAQAICAGDVDLEALKSPDLSDAEVEMRLRSLRGIGPYAAANVLMLLGRYDFLPVDSWLRKTVREGWFGGRDVPDRELVAAFEHYRPHRVLVYRFYDWEGARQDIGDASR